MAAPPDDAKNLQNTLNSLAGNISMLTEGVKNIDEYMRKTEDSTVRVSKEFERASITMRSLITYAGDWKETIGEVLHLSKKMATGGIFDAKTYANAQKQLRGFIDAQKELLHSTGMTTSQQKILNKMIDGLERSWSSLGQRAKLAGKSMNDAMDTSHIVAVQKELLSTVSVVGKLVTGLKKIDMGPLTGASKAMSELIGKQGRLQKWISQGERLKGVKEDISSRILGTKKDFAARMANQTYTYPDGSKGGRSYSASHIVTSKQQWNALKPHEKARASAAARAANANLEGDVEDIVPQRSMGKLSPRGAIDRYMARKVINNRNIAGMTGEDIKGGITGAGGLDLIARGGGSFTKGLGVAAEGGIGDLAGSLGAVSGAAAIPLAIGEGLKDIFDATTERNKDVYSKLGTSSMFSQGNQTGTMAFENMKQNLTPGLSDQLYNKLGSHYESNLKIAAAMSASGLDMGEIARKGNTMESGNIIGRIGNTVRIGARLAGMDEAQGTEQIIKLLQQYHVSLEGTDKFFDKLNKDTKAAGITSTKYIEIIDSITSSFDHMAKSLDEVTGVMRVLGTTGTMTAETMEDTMKGIAGVGGPEKSIEQKAFIGTQVMGNASFMHHLVGGYQGEVESQKGEAINALTKVGLDTSKLDLNSSRGVQSAIDALNAHASMLGPDARGSTDFKTAYATLNELQTRHMRLDAASRFSNNRTGQGAVNYAASSELTPENYYGKAMMNIGGMESAMKMSNVSFGSLMSDPTQLNNNPLLLSKLADQMGVSKETFMASVRGTHQAAASYAGLAKAGSAEITTNEYEKMAALIGKKGLKGEAAKAAITSLNEEGVKGLTSALTRNSETLYDMQDSSSALRKALAASAEAVDKAEQKKKAEETAVAMTPTAKIFADAFTDLFNSISRPVMTIVDMLEKIPMLSNKATDNDIQDIRNMTEQSTKYASEMSSAIDALQKDSSKYAALAEAETNPVKKQHYLDEQAEADKQAKAMSDVVKTATNGLAILNSGGVLTKTDYQRTADAMAQTQDYAKALASPKGVGMVRNTGGGTMVDINPEILSLNKNPVAGSTAANVTAADVGSATPSISVDHSKHVTITHTPVNVQAPQSSDSVGPGAKGGEVAPQPLNYGLTANHGSNF
jgi:hypothetical protein